MTTTINSYQNNPFYIIPADGTPVSKKLPKELEQYIFSLLAPRDLQSALQVSKPFTIMLMDVAKQKEIFFLKIFGKFLQKNTDIDQIQEICSLGEQNLLKCTNLTTIKSTSKILKEDFINSLKGLKKEDFTKLKTESTKLNKSHLFHNIFYLAAIYQQIEINEKLPISSARDEAFLDICMLLAQKGGNFSKAVEVANKISDKNCKKRALKVINQTKPHKTESNHSIIRSIRSAFTIKF